MLSRRGILFGLQYICLCSINLRYRFRRCIYLFEMLLCMHCLVRVFLSTVIRYWTLIDRVIILHFRNNNVCCQLLSLRFLMLLIKIEVFLTASKLKHLGINLIDISQVMSIIYCVIGGSIIRWLPGAPLFSHTVVSWWHSQFRRCSIRLLLSHVKFRLN